MNHSLDPLWHDREIRFDIAIDHLRPRRGEVEIDSINSVEDTKGNNGEKGALGVTNLRFIWCSHRNPKINLSVGLACIHSLSIKSVESALKGKSAALYMMAKHGTARFEFIFTSLVKNSPRLFTTAQAIYKSYESTRLYRDLKLRGAILHDKQLMLLPGESVVNKIDGVWNLSADQGNLGTMYLTTVRIVWHANLAENFNVSIPYLQIILARIRKSKFGPALVIETHQRSGGYILGFRIDPMDRLESIHHELSALHTVYSADPNFGVVYKIEENALPLSERKAEKKIDDVEIIEDAHVDVMATYAADRVDGGSGGEPIYSYELGIAIEKLPDNLSIESLWNINY
jgi:Bardet-Biedl syndrome 5 protein